MPSSEELIKVENVSKAFSLRTKSFSLRQDALKLGQQFLKPPQKNRTETFYALQDINFTIKKGEAVAIIGRNGAGKTTLLRILSNILAPTCGNVSVNGRFTALIGLGTGFINSMTGIENIFLNAAMFGNSPRDTEQLLAQIITFADIGDFINAPVKDYSSGMRARLGFSVAIHILADIVLLDEILAVGDAAFKEKCEQKLQELQNENRTFVIVSHTSSVGELCNRALWLHHGRLIKDGPFDEVWQSYQEFSGIFDRGD